MKALAITYSTSKEAQELPLHLQREIHFPRYIPRVRTSFSSKVPDHQRVQITNSDDAVDVLRAKWHRNKIQHVEEFKIILLNRANRVLGVADISLGGVAGCVADPKIIFQIAISANACGLILSHNHPSGNLKASDQDYKLTFKLKEAGLLLDLPILDHIILTKDGHLSFADNGML